MSAHHRSRRDSAGIGPHVRSGIRLVPLGELHDAHIADGEPDIRGWEVRTVSGREVGRVHELLADVAAGEVVMLDVDLAGGERHTIAPIRAAQLDRERRVVLLDTAELHDVESFPSLARHAALTDEEARLFSQGYERAYGARGWDRDQDTRVARGADDMRFHRREADLGGAAPGARGERAIAIDRDVARQPAAERDGERERQRARERQRDIEQERELALADDRLRAQLRYASPQHGAADDAVVEQRPVVIEEVVVRRRVLDAADRAANDDDLHAAAIDPNARRDPGLRRGEEANP